MKLCVPTETDRGLDAVTAAHFGTAPYFTLVDLEDDTVTIVKNPACGHAPGACHHLDILRAHDVDVVASGGIGRRAFTALEEAGIRVVRAPSSTVGEIVAKVRAGEAVSVSLSQTCVGHHHGPGHRHRHRHRHGHA
jgi:predicted Fe-Mo cluster-binding NifX family protein